MSEKTQQLEKLLTHKKSIQYYASRLQISENEVKELLLEIRNKPAVSLITEKPTVFVKPNEEHILEVSNENGTLKSSIETTFEPKNDEELAELHKIDLNKYKISSYWSKLKSNGKFTSSVFCTLRKPSDYTLEDFVKFLEGYEVKISHSTQPHSTLPHVDVEISIADFHLDKKVFEGESIEEKKATYLNILRSLVENIVAIYKVDKLVFVIGNDFFHTDNYQNQTTNLTPQDVLSDFANEYEHGFDLLASAIVYLKDVCSYLEVILVQGNHDRTKAFYVAHALSVLFKDVPSIYFNRENSTTKTTMMGDTFIGYHHGNTKTDDLPLLFATGKDSFSFGAAKYREIHTGDKHFYMAKEIKGVRIVQSPSLSGTDRWHRDNNYVNNVRAALATVYHPSKGKIAEFEERIQL